MLLNFIDQKIRKAFSDAAYEYDLLTSLHKEIGRELIKKSIDLQSNDVILDIGMGTGWLTSKLKFYFPESKVVGIDFAEGMTKAAKGQYDDFDILQANAKTLPFKEESFDLIISNLSLQWVSDLEELFTNIRRASKEKGVLQFTMFGFDTFKELFTSLEAAKGHLKDEPFNMERLKSMSQVQEALKKAGYKDIEIQNEFIRVHFRDMYQLIKWIKDIGANCLAREMFIGKELLAQANEYYEENFKDKFGVNATFEVIWVKTAK